MTSTMDSVTLPRVTAIIPVLNRKDDLGRCLQSMQGQSGVDLEILVMDDGSTDGVETFLADRYPSVRFVHDGKNYGPGYRRNQGALLGRGDYLLFLDSDTLFQESTTIATMVHHLEADRTIGTIGGEIALHGGEHTVAAGVKLDAAGYPYRVMARMPDGPVGCDYVASLNVMVRSMVFFAVGGFDPYFEWGAEDMDFGRRVRRSGLKNILRFDCAVGHTASPVSRPGDASYRYLLGSLRYRFKTERTCMVLARIAWYLFRYGVIHPLWNVVFRPVENKRDAGRSTEPSGSLIARACWWHICHLLPTWRSIASNYANQAALKTFREWKGVE